MTLSTAFSSCSLSEELMTYALGTFSLFTYAGHFFMPSPCGCLEQHRESAAGLTVTANIWCGRDKFMANVKKYWRWPGCRQDHRGCFQGWACSCSENKDCCYPQWIGDGAAEHEDRPMHFPSRRGEQHSYGKS